MKPQRFQFSAQLSNHHQASVSTRLYESQCLDNVWENMSTRTSYNVTCQKYKLQNNLKTALFWVSSGNFLPTFRDNLSAQSPRTDNLQQSRIQASWPLKTGPRVCPEILVRNYRYSLRNTPSKSAVVIHFTAEAWNLSHSTIRLLYQT